MGSSCSSYVCGCVCGCDPVSLSTAGFFDRPQRVWSDRPKTDPANAGVEFVRQYVVDRLEFLGPLDLRRMVIEYLIWTIEPGSMIDVLCVTLDHKAYERPQWNVCLIEDVRDGQVLVRPVDRVHPYPYQHPQRKRHEWFPIDSWNLEPYLTRVRRPKPADLIEGDLVDVIDPISDLPHVGFVLSRVDGQLWITLVDNYKSAAHKAECRVWLPTNADCLAPYRDPRHRPPNDADPRFGLQKRATMAALADGSPPFEVIITDRISYLVIGQSLSGASLIHSHLSSEHMMKTNATTIAPDPRPSTAAKNLADLYPQHQPQI